MLYKQITPFKIYFFYCFNIVFSTKYEYSMAS